MFLGRAKAFSERLADFYGKSLRVSTAGLARPRGLSSQYSIRCCHTKISINNTTTNGHDCSDETYWHWRLTFICNIISLLLFFQSLKNVKSVLSLQAVQKQAVSQGFPCDSVVKNPSANAGDTGSIPALGRSHPWRGNQAGEPQLLSLPSRAQEPQLLKLAFPRVHALQLEKPLQWEAGISQRKAAYPPTPLIANRKVCTARRPAHPK